MIIDCISDLHGHYPELPGGDLLIIAGDLTGNGSLVEYAKAFKWIANAAYKKKILVGGNHDLLFQHEEWFAKTTEDFEYLCDQRTKYRLYTHLEVDSVQEGFLCKIQDARIWGSPWTLASPGMDPKCKAFTVDTEEELQKKWALIPKEIDVLVTHSPPYQFGDEIIDWDTGKATHFGSKSLMEAVGLIKPKLHIFGHIHEGHSKSKVQWDEERSTIFANVSHVDENCRPKNEPMRFIL